jgi:hypothetical protein
LTPTSASNILSRELRRPHPISNQKIPLTTITVSMGIEAGRGR